MCKSIMLTSPSTHSNFSDLFRNEQAALEYVNHLVNGNFLYTDSAASIADNISAKISVLCLYVKNFNLDWIADGAENLPLLQKKQYFADFGSLVMPVVQMLTNELERQWLESATSSCTFTRKVDWYWSALGLTKFLTRSRKRSRQSDPRWLISLYVSTIMTALNLAHAMNGLKLPNWIIRPSRNRRGLVLVRTSKKYIKSSYHTTKLKTSFWEYKLPLSSPLVNDITY